GVTNVLFNDVKYNVKEIKVFRPSLHTYNGNKAVAEMIIVHTGIYGNLLVCIPFKVGSGSHPFISALCSNGPCASEGSKTINVSDFNLGNIIPKSEYYSYSGTLPYGKCDGTYNFVVFDVNKGYISTSATDLNNLTTLISKNAIKVRAGPVFYNKQGTTQNAFDGGGEIYIDCQPTGNDGEEIFIKPRKVPIDSNTSDNSTDVFDMLQSNGAQIGMGIAAFIAVYYIGEKILKKIAPEHV
ncbi:unnamed protein product, partial [marine sediment metagenome]